MALYEVGRLRRNEMEDSVFIKTESAFGKICFWFHISNFWQKQKQKIPVYGGFRTRQICLNNSLGLSIGSWGAKGAICHPNIFADHNISVATT